MDKRELEQLYYMDREIRCLEQELYETEHKWRHIALEGGSQPAGQTGDKTGNTAVKVLEYTDRINAALARLYESKTEAERYIESVQDTQLRMVMRMRYIKFYSWQAIAGVIGSRYKSTPAMMIKRYWDNMNEM